MEIKPRPTDQPLEAPEQDALGYAVFSKHLASVLYQMNVAPGFVVAINGPWGSGKSTILNFIHHYLTQSPELSPPILMRFNPWWYTGSDELVKQFFAELARVLSVRLNLSGEVFQAIGTLANVASKGSTPISWAASLFTSPAAGAEKSIPELKATVSKVLTDSEKRLIILVDDIDRLTSEETRSVFRLVRNFADFPNVVYLMAFDQSVVAASLENIQGRGKGGQLYIEKIIQAPFNLPQLSRQQLLELLFNKLPPELAAGINSCEYTGYVRSLLNGGLDYFLRTPRNIIRLCNTLQLTYVAVHGEVNSVDFLALEVLRLHCPDIYETIKNNPSPFTANVSDMGFRGISSQNSQAFHRGWIESVDADSRSAVKRIVATLFPNVQAVIQDLKLGFVERPANLRRFLHVASEDVFPTYFRLSVPESVVPMSEISEALKLTGSRDEFVKFLRKIAGHFFSDGRSRIRAFLQRFLDFAPESIKVECIANIVWGLFDVGDDLLSIEESPVGVFDVGVEVDVARILWQLLRRLDKESRQSILREAVGSCRAVCTVVREVSVWTSEPEKAQMPEYRSTAGDLFLSPEFGIELKALALERIRGLASNGKLPDIQKWAVVLFRWRDWAESTEVADWVRGLVQGDDGLITFLRAMVQTGVEEMANRPATKTKGIPLNYIEAFVPPAELEKRVVDIVTNPNTSEPDREVGNLFLNALQKSKKSSKGSTPRASDGAAAEGDTDSSDRA